MFMALESDQLIAVLTAQYKKLLTENWLELWAYPVRGVAVDWVELIGSYHASSALGPRSGSTGSRRSQKIKASPKADFAFELRKPKERDKNRQ